MHHNFCKNLPTTGPLLFKVLVECVQARNVGPHTGSHLPSPVTEYEQIKFILVQVSIIRMRG